MASFYHFYKWKLIQYNKRLSVVRWKWWKVLWSQPIQSFGKAISKAVSKAVGNDAGKAVDKAIGKTVSKAAGIAVDTAISYLSV